MQQISHQIAHEAAISLFRELVELLRLAFPHYAQALSGEISGTRMTEERWHRVAAVISSLHTLPGNAFNQTEHDVRNTALTAVPVAQKMAQACVGIRDVDSCRAFVAWYAADIRGRIATIQKRE